MQEFRSELSATEVEELAQTHAYHEDRGEFEPLLRTLTSDAVYQFCPLGVQLEGVDAVLRYYERVERHYSPLVEQSRVEMFVASESAAAIEYALQLRLDGGRVDDRLVVVLPVRGRLFSGERIYSSERVLRLLLGEMIDETRPIPGSDWPVEPGATRVGE
jgi:hypothetical protein